MPQKLTKREEAIIERTTATVLSKLGLKSEEAFISRTAAVKKLGMSKYHLMKLRENGTIRFKKGKAKQSHVLYCAKDIEKYLEGEDNGLSEFRGEQL